MPEMTLLGWFHTIIGVGAVLSGFYTIFKYKVISLEEFIGRLYLLLTLITFKKTFFDRNLSFLFLNKTPGNKPVSINI